MKRYFSRKAVLGLAAAAAVFGAGVLAGANKFGTPNSVVHVVTVQWKSSATAEQKAAAIEGVRKMAAEVPGIKNIWLKTLKVQPRDYNAAIVMEFKDQAAFDAYKDAPAHKEWEKIYLPIRAESTTHDITN
ncbi:MAG TPA: Dabb family protein [Bryobacteraceae bacterium]|nr:Dabb family protein [Bryobacteraceae bacterium]